MSSRRVNLAHPIPMTDVPYAVKHLYDECSDFLAKCRLSVRYFTPEPADRWPPELLRRVHVDTASLILQNRSLCATRSNPKRIVWEDDVEASKSVSSAASSSTTDGGDPHNHSQSHNRARHLILDDPFETPSDAAKAAKLLAYNAFTDSSQLNKSVGLQIQNNNYSAWIPIWGSSFACYDSFPEERELKFVYLLRIFPKEVAVELTEVLFVHSLIEMCFWSPRAFERPFVDLSHRLISMAANTDMPLYPIELLKLLERSEILDQHFEEENANRPHTPVSCTCRSLKNWKRTFLVNKVVKICDYFTGPYLSKILRAREYVEKGPSASLLQALVLLFESTESRFYKLAFQSAHKTNT